ncbi:putative peptidoglycan-recognition protein SC2-like [Apostichopus japonicus]|uniref:Putative peptidoglycan-recognition protein SC2-like n=1 Tax=Stichopus japonicus TaxID=307972 RepID=A0A2G8LL45_STIJA|nr:putative peptidoglycan-recognition protein SC2-like [Apostichopus japonicus]
MGNFTVKLPNQKSVDAVSSLIKCAIEENKLKDSYILYGHRQVRDTSCPGDALFKEIQSWPHWKPGQHYPPNQSKPFLNKKLYITIKFSIKDPMGDSRFPEDVTGRQVFVDTEIIN